MTLAGQEIQRNLRRFVSRWRGYDGGERTEAQTFVNELFAAYGTDRQAAGVTRANGATGGVSLSPGRACAPPPQGMGRCVGVGRVGKRTLVAWTSPGWTPSEKVVVVALDEDYHFGVLTSSAHTTWARYRGLTLKADPAYTPTTVFPWPEPDDGQRARVAAAHEVAARRVDACDGRRGLTTVYNLMDDGGFVDLAAAHRELNAAAVDAYGWTAGVVGDPYQLIPRLMDLNREVVEGRGAYHPFPGRDRASEQGTLYLAGDEGG